MDSSKEDQLFLSRMRDLADRADRSSWIVYSDFLDGGKRTLVESHKFLAELKNAGVKMQLFGGYEQAERVIAAFYPSFLDVHMEKGLPDPDYESPLKAIQISLRSAKFARKIPQHRDYLGALMGLGIKRESMGDILVNGEEAVIFTLDTMAPFLLENITSIGSCEADVEEIPLADAGQVQPDGKEMVINISSERLDAVISKTFGISRQDALKLTQAGRVMLNFKECTKNDQVLHDGDLLSVRGHGRIQIVEQAGTSRSGRIQLKIIRYS